MPSDGEHLIVDDTRYETRLTRKVRERGAWQPRDPHVVTAQIPGQILDVHVVCGDEIARGQGIMVLEAMKMRNEVLATAAGVVEKVPVAAGQTVARGDVLLELKRDPA